MATQQQINLLENCLSGFLEDALVSNELNSYQLDPTTSTGTSQQQLLQPSPSFDAEIARFFRQQVQSAPQKPSQGSVLPKLSPIRLGRSTSFERNLPPPASEAPSRKQENQPLSEPSLAPLRLNSLELLEIHHSFLDDGKEALPLTELFWDDAPTATITIHRSGETPDAKRAKRNTQVAADAQTIPNQPFKDAFDLPEPATSSEMPASLELASVGSLGFNSSIPWDAFQDGLGIASLSPLPSLRLPPADEIVSPQPVETDVQMGQCDYTPQAGALPEGKLTLPPSSLSALMCEESLDPGLEQPWQKQAWQTPTRNPNETIVPSPEKILQTPSQPSPAPPRKAGRKRLPVDHITLESLQEQGLFDVPIQAAAQELGVGLSVLKRICRQIGLARWPFRTRQSLRGVIAKTEQYLTEDATGDAQKAEVVEALQKTLNGLQGEAGQGLSDSVRKYRQSVFKLNYKIKKNAGKSQAATAAAQPAIPATAAARMAAASVRDSPHVNTPGGNAGARSYAEDCQPLPFDSSSMARDFKMDDAEDWIPGTGYPGEI